MNWLTIARKDFRDARRSKMLWGATAIYLLIVVGLFGANAEQGTDVAMSSLVGLGAFFLPLLIVVMAYLSITGERESGSIKYLLGFSATRSEIVVGKFVGRSMIALLGVFVALVVGGVVMALQYDSMPLGDYAVFVFLTLYFTVVWVGIVVGLSALSSARGRALGSTLGAYFLFSVFWIAIPDVSPQDGVAYVIESLLGLEPIPELYDLVMHISPSFTYFFVGNAVAFNDAHVASLHAGDYGGSPPVYLQDWFSLLAMALWILVPLAVGYVRFRDAELN